MHERNRALARKALADLLRQMHDITAWRVTLVLDGKLGTPVPVTNPKRTDMVICYATADQTADSIIERLVASSGVAPSILVITADEAERLTVESLGAMTASPSWLREEMDRENKSFSLELHRVHRSAKWK